MMRPHTAMESTMMPMTPAMRMRVHLDDWQKPGCSGGGVQQGSGSTVVWNSRRLPYSEYSG